MKARHGSEFLHAGVLSLLLASACSSPQEQKVAPIFDPGTVERDFSVVVTCRHSHEHDLRHVQTYADAASAEIFAACVTGSEAECDHEGFPEGSLFVKYEYENEGCEAEDLVSYSASLRLRDGSSRAGRDWHWQRANPDLEIVSDGAPAPCLTCHIDHCSAPAGFDLRCRPD